MDDLSIIDHNDDEIPTGPSMLFSLPDQANGVFMDPQWGETMRLLVTHPHVMPYYIIIKQVQVNHE
jgi:hypothetical protein